MKPEENSGRRVLGIFAATAAMAAVLASKGRADSGATVQPQAQAQETVKDPGAATQIETTSSSPRGPFSVGGAQSEGAEIVGKISFSGVPPPERQIVFGQFDPCANWMKAPQTTRFYQVGPNGGLANTLVYLEPVGEADPLKKEWPLRAESIPLVYTGCRIEPYISGAQVGQTLLLHNLDPGGHNAHIIPGNRATIGKNLALMPASEPTRTELLATDPEMRVKCDVHPWEIAYLKVFDHPFFAVTGEDGSFRLTGVPRGEYVLKAWHRRSGAPQEKRLQVTERKRIEQNFVFEAER